ncbi:unnamed protein product [Cercopithifilaria johnstoni]|uniref:Uncharacterized protein n=1 Tax=Cercopithifilaria johnstoni TaxID=2874296 RepID=A0A8J2Q3L7_9BILA|nr:unnamed protein product [Cercopithifilaria johnstoni]
MAQNQRPLIYQRVTPMHSIIETTTAIPANLCPPNDRCLLRAPLQSTPPQQPKPVPQPVTPRYCVPMSSVQLFISSGFRNVLEPLVGGAYSDNNQ